MYCSYCSYYTVNKYENKTICGHKSKEMIERQPFDRKCSYFMHNKGSEYEEGYNDGIADLKNDVEEVISNY